LISKTSRHLPALKVLHLAPRLPSRSAAAQQHKRTAANSLAAVKAAAKARAVKVTDVPFDVPLQNAYMYLDKEYLYLPPELFVDPATNPPPYIPYDHLAPVSK
jgi:hypothetical protein